MPLQRDWGGGKEVSKAGLQFVQEIKMENLRWHLKTSEFHKLLPFFLKHPTHCSLRPLWHSVVYGFKSSTRVLKRTYIPTQLPQRGSQTQKHYCRISVLSSFFVLKLFKNDTITTCKQVIVKKREQSNV